MEGRVDPTTKENMGKVVNCGETQPIDDTSKSNLVNRLHVIPIVR